MTKTNNAMIDDNSKLTVDDACKLGDEELVGTFRDNALSFQHINDFANIAKDKFKELSEIVNQKDEAVHNSRYDDFFQDPEVQEAEARILNWITFNLSKVQTLVESMAKESREKRFEFADNVKYYVGYRQDMDIDSTGGYEPEFDETDSDK